MVKKFEESGADAFWCLSWHAEIGGVGSELEAALGGVVLFRGITRRPSAQECICLLRNAGRYQQSRERRQARRKHRVISFFPPRSQLSVDYRNSHHESTQQDAKYMGSSPSLSYFKK